LLDKVPGRTAFVGLSFLIRIVEAVGNSAFLNASFTIIAKEFPDMVATMFATLETFFGIGLIVGPTVGGAMYQAGGYILPFAVLGSFLIFAAILTYFILPERYNERDGGLQETQEKGLCDLLRIPSIALAAFSILSTSLSIAFLQATLEPHLRQFELSPSQMGAMFVVNGGVYAFSAPIWGYMCDKRLPPIIVTLLGSVCIAVAFLFIGPVPFIPVPTSLGLCIGMLFIHGLGFAAQLVAAFSSAHSEALIAGFPDNVHTYALVSGLWTATFALGAFIGPSFGGVLMDVVGFGYATLFVFGSQVIVFVLTLGFIIHRSRNGSYDKEYSPIDEVVTDNVFINTDNFDGEGGGTEAAVEATDNTTSPDSGSFSEHCDQISHQEELNKRLLTSNKRQQASNIRQRIPSGRSRNRSRSGGGAGGAPIFSPSPMDPSPVSLRGGFMGLTVPSSHMNDIYEEGLLDTIEAGLGASRQQTSSERTPLLGGKTLTNVK